MDEAIQETNAETSNPKNHVDKFKIPLMGMTFETMEKTWWYGRHVGFWIQAQISSKTRWGSNYLTNRQLFFH